MSTNIFKQFLNGSLTVNEFAVFTVVNTKAGKQSVLAGTTTTQIAEALNNGLSRHAVARALRNLQRKQFIDWQTQGIGGGLSTITVR